MERRAARSALWGAAAAMALCGCEMFDYHPYCVDISGRTDINSSNAAAIESALDGKRSFKFAFISDTQRWFDETEDMVADINSRDDIDFVVHGGDMTDFGINDEFLWQRDVLERLDVPYVAVIGNHDCLGTGMESYRKIWGELNYSFVAGDVKFLCLNTNALEFDYSNPIPDMSFIAAESRNYPEGVTRTIVVAHTRPGDEQFNNNMAVYYHAVIRMLPGTLCAISGHGHTFFHKDIYGDGFMYHATTCAEDRAYMIFTIDEEGYSYEEIYL